MKQLLKSVTPPTLLNIARKFASCTQLLMMPAAIFNSDSLKTRSVTDIESIFSNFDFSSSWKTTHNYIKVLYRTEDKMGGVNPGDRQALYYLVMGFTPENVLEIGTHIGASTLHIASALKQLGTKLKVTSIDIADVNHPKTGAWRKIGLSASPKEFARRPDCLDYIDFQMMSSLDWMCTTKQCYDFIFLDGDHKAKVVYQELSAALSLLTSSGIILLHDYYPKGKALFPDKNIISGPMLHWSV